MDERKVPLLNSYNEKNSAMCASELEKGLKGKKSHERSYSVNDLSFLHRRESDGIFIKML